MTRKSYICNPNPPYNLIPIEEYVRAPKSGIHIIPDIEPFVSPVDKKVVRGRRDLRDHNRRHNVTNAADFSPEYYKEKQRENKRVFEKGRPDRIEAIKRALEIHNVRS